MAAPSTSRPISRGILRFSAVTWVGVVAVALVATVAVAILLGPSVGPGPVADESPSPAPTESVDETFSPTAAPTPIATPTVPGTPTETPAPPSDTAWTALAWSEAVTPSFTVHLFDLVPWQDGYVAVGELPTAYRGSDGAFLASSDGLRWAVVQRIVPGTGRIPHHLAVLDGELYAFSEMDMDRLPLGGQFGHVVWRSSDGATWSEVDSASWRDAWSGLWIGPMPESWSRAQHEIRSGLVDVVGGPTGLVVIGNSFREDGMIPVLLHSADGSTWTERALPAGSDSAMLNSIEVHEGRFVITGAVGVGADPAAAMAAAWYSDDAIGWSRASVEASAAASGVGREFGPLHAASDGLLTCSGNREMGAGGWRYMTEWLSSDGSAWRVAPRLDDNPGCDWVASDGTRMVALGPRAHAAPFEWPGVTRAWTSANGEDWQSLTLSSALADLPERFWVVPEGVIYAGVQSFWFGEPVVP